MPEHRALRAPSGAQGFAIVLLYKKNTKKQADLGGDGGLEILLRTLLIAHILCTYYLLLFGLPLGASLGMRD